jgi:hypothetical protein
MQRAECADTLNPIGTVITMMSSPHAALIVDTDPKGLESLIYGFQGAEWRMTACPSPETASLLVKASGAEIVVVASRHEHDRIHILVRHLRSKEAFRTLPVLVLGPEDLRPSLKESGEVDLLTLPAFVRDVLTSSELLVATRATAAHKPGEEPCFQAPITSTRTLSLVRSMNGLCRSGHLRLERNGRVGEIMFHEGELSAATVGQIQGMAGLQHLMVWNDGNLELRLRDVPRRGQFHQTEHEFLDELDRFQRDYVFAIKHIGPLTTVYSADEQRLKQSAGAVPAEVTPVVRLCDGKRTLSDIMDESPFRVLDTVRILGRLAELRILTRRDGKPVAGATEPRDEFLDTARILGPASAWPKIAPVGGFPTPVPVFRTPILQTQPPQEQAKEPPKEQAKEAAKAQPKQPPHKPPKEATSRGGAPPQAEGDTHNRRRTLEIGLPATVADLAGQAPAPAGTPAAKPATTAAPIGAAIPSKPASATPAAKLAVTTTTIMGPIASKPAPATPAAKHAATSATIMGPVALKPASATPAAKHAAPPPTSPAILPQSPFPLATEPAAAVPVAHEAAMQTSGTFATKPASPTPATKPPAPAAAGGTIVPQSPSQPAAANPAGSVTQTGGILETRKSERHTQPTVRAAGARRSVVIESIPTEDVKTPLPLPTTPHARAGVSSPSPDFAPAESNSAPVAGVLDVPPSRKTPTQISAPNRVSIQLDTSLAAQLDTPSAPAPAAAVTKPAPARAQVTGEMQVAPSGRSTRTMGKPATPSSSFQIDPSLSGEVPAAATPAPRRSDSRPIPGRTDSRPMPRTDSRPIPLRRSDSRPIPGAKTRHPSGSFSAVESDFFEREAELYKEEKPESFADLDDGKGDGKAKTDTRRKLGTKPGRPYRK